MIKNAINTFLGEFGFGKYRWARKFMGGVWVVSHDTSMWLVLTDGDKADIANNELINKWGHDGVIEDYSKK